MTCADLFKPKEREAPLTLLGFSRRFSLQPETTVSDAYRELQTRGGLITQDEWHLPSSCKGGTCASTSNANVLLAGMEAYYPGRISRMDPISRILLHRRLMMAFRDAIQEDYRIDISEGVPITYANHVANTVMKTVFGDDAIPVSVYTDTDEAQIFQNLDFNSTSIEILSLGTWRDSRHAVVALGVTREPGDGQSFNFEISDPHHPRRSVEMTAFVQDDLLHFKRTTEAREQRLSEWAGGKKAPPVNAFSIYSFNRPLDMKDWSAKKVIKKFPRVGERRYRVTLRSGAVFKNIVLIRPPSKIQPDSDAERYLSFYNRFLLKGSFDYSDIATIDELN